MAGSALTKLRSELKSSGLSRTSKPKDPRKRKQLSSGSQEFRKTTLDNIGKDFNKFDTREENKKHQVITRGGKLEEGKKGAPGKSRQAGLEQRKKTLLPLLEGRNHTSTFVDRRFGEDSSTLTLEEKALERFTAERTSRLGGSKKARFNLEDGETAGDEGGLTHGGRKLGFGDEEELDAGGWGGLGDGGIVNSNHEPLLRRRMQAEAEAEDEPPRKRSKAEIMEEVMAKSKAYKHERQKNKSADDETRLELDAGLKDLRLLLGGGGTIPRPFEAGAAPKPVEEEEDDEEEDDDEESDENSDEDNSEGMDDDALEAALSGKSGVDRELLRKLIGNGGMDSEEEEEFIVEPMAHPSLPSQADSYGAMSTERPAPARAAAKDEADPYDSYVRLLALEPRAQASDRLKTPLELAKDAAKELEEREEKRLRRQRGEADESGEEGTSNKKKKRAPQGDDLEDDFLQEGSDDDEEMIEEGLGKGLEGGFGHQVIADESEKSEEEGSDEESSEGDEDDQMVGDIEGDLTDEEVDTGAPEALVSAPILESTKSRTWGGKDVKPELPFTFPCPTTHSEFVKLLSKAGIPEADTATVVKRIRVLYHPGLGAENTGKLQAFAEVLLDHILHLSATPSPSTFTTINSLLPHLLTLSHAYPLATAPHYVTKLALMQKNFTRGVAHGVLDPTSKTWPGVPELTLLRLVGMVWSTSDLSHPVAAAAILLIGQYLAQSRVRSLGDISAGLFLCTLAAQYEVLSKRLVPEAMNFLLNAFLILVPSSINSKNVPGSFPSPDLAQDHVKNLRLKSTAELIPQKLNFSTSLVGKSSDTQLKVDLVSSTISLLNEFAEMYVSMDGFVELFKPAEAVVAKASLKNVPASIKTQVNELQISFKRMLNLATNSRKPLLLQYHKPIPIASFMPKFDEGYNHNQKFDPDTERAEASKLKSLYKKEKKGAIRELRKDNRFLAGEEQKRKVAKDAEYTKKIATIMGSLQDERAEEKRFEATKSKGKRMDKARAKK